MNQSHFTPAKKYALKFLTVYCSIATLLFVGITLSTIATIPTLKSVDLTHVSRHKIDEGLQMSQHVWIGLFFTPILIAAIVLLIDVVTDLYLYRVNTKKTQLDERKQK